MKNFLFVLFVFAGLSVHAQVRRFELSGGISNNGQIQKVVDDYFYITNPLYLLDQTKSAESSSFKYTLAARVYINDHVSLRVKYGNAKSHNEYDFISYELSGYFWNKQKITNISPALCLNKNIGRLNISTGIEFAFYSVHDFESYFKGNDLVIFTFDQTTYYFPRLVESETIIDGGKATGINSFLELEYLFSKRMGIGASLSYGYLWTKFGDKILQKETYDWMGAPIFNAPTSSYINQDKSYKHKSFSPPEVAVFLFLQLGKKLETPKLN